MGKIKIIFAIVVIYFIYKGSFDQPWYIVPLILGAIFLWTFIEYTGHRFVFHSKPKSAFGKKMLYVIHGAHHDYNASRNCQTVNSRTRYFVVG